MACFPSKIMEFMTLIGRLKSTKRAGWVRTNIPDPETVAGHMYRMSTLALLLRPEHNLDKNKCIQLSLVHDMAECIVGDITPHDGISEVDKHKKEAKAMEYLQTLLDVHTGEEIKSLWLEYENQSTPESQFVKDLDRFDMILQAFEYEQQLNQPEKLQEFFDSTKGKFHHPLVKEWVEELYKWRTTAQKKQ